MKPVLIVEDHPLVAEATGKLLARCNDQISLMVCSNAVQTVERLDDANEPWFRIFLDLDVPGAYGLSLAREVQTRGLAGRCCIVSAFERREYVDEIRKSGFLGYIVKAVAVAEFTASVLEVLAGRPTFPVLVSGRRAQAIRITRRQAEMLKLIRQGLSSKEIAAALHIAEGTVNNHVAAILQIFDAGTRAQAVATAIELGLLENHSYDSSDARRPLLPGGR